MLFEGRRLTIFTFSLFTIQFLGISFVLLYAYFSNEGKDDSKGENFEDTLYMFVNER